MISVRLKPLFISLFIPLVLVGGLGSIFSAGAPALYAQLKLPPLSPPAWVYPVVWTILYTLMGIASYLVYDSSSPQKDTALTVYAIGLFLNLLWSWVFFSLNNYWAAAVIILVLLVVIFITIMLFARISETAGWLMVPYAVWVGFAAFLNLYIAMNN